MRFGQGSLARWGRWLAWLGAAAAFSLAALILLNAGLPDQVTLLAQETPGPEAPPVAPVVGGMAPDFEVVNTAGQTLALADLHGQTIILNFWATWCGPCRVEMPELQAIYAEHRAAMRVLAINVDESPAVFVPWAAAQGLTFDLISDLERHIQTLYHVRGTPQTVVIGPDGMIHAIFYGPITFQRLHRVLDAIQA